MQGDGKFTCRSVRKLHSTIKKDDWRGTNCFHSRQMDFFYFLKRIIIIVTTLAEFNSGIYFLI